MAGPYVNKDNKENINTTISVTPHQPTDNNIEKDYNIQIESTNNIDNNDNDNIEEDEWHYDDVLNISDDEENVTNTNELIIPTFKLKTQGSVVDMLMAGPYVNKDNKENINTTISVTPHQPTDNNIEKDYNIQIESTNNVDNNDNDNVEDDEWHYDDVLNISDEEEKNDTNTNELIIPMFKLKTQGSV
eukprot:712253_1